MKNYVLVASLIFILVTPNAFAFWPFDADTKTDSNIIIVRQKDSIISYNPSTKQGSWQSAPEWILDYTDWKGKPIYEPYKIWDSSTYTTFENAQASITMEKSSCSLKIFDGGKVESKTNPILNSISFSLQYAINGTDDWKQAPENSQECNISWNNSTNGLTANMKQGSSIMKNVELRLYDDAIPELILKVTNNDLSKNDVKYGYAITISDPSETIVEGDLIKFMDSSGKVIFVFDTQNSINHYLWNIKKLNNSLILDYKNAKGPLQPLHTLEIDPTFTTNPSPNIYNLKDGGTTSCGSYSSTTTSATIMSAYQSFVGTNGCGNSAAEFSITSFPQTAVVSSVQISGTLTSSGTGAASTCSFVQDLDRPSTTTGSTLYPYIASATVYASTSCNLGGSSTKINLGSTSITDLHNQYSSGWYAVGFRYAGAGGDSVMGVGSTQLLINYTLPVPNSVTGLTCNPSQALGITCSWNNST